MKVIKVMEDGVFVFNDIFVEMKSYNMASTKPNREYFEVTYYSLDNITNVIGGVNNSSFNMYFKPSTYSKSLVKFDDIEEFLKRNPIFTKFIKDVVMTKIGDMK